MTNTKLVTNNIKRWSMNAPHHKPIISVKEARKLLGTAGDALTDGELQDMILQSEQMLRFIFREYLVHNSTVV